MPGIGNKGLFDKHLTNIADLRLGSSCQAKSQSGDNKCENALDYTLSRNDHDWFSTCVLSACETEYYILFFPFSAEPSIVCIAQRLKKK